MFGVVESWDGQLVPSVIGPFADRGAAVSCARALAEEIINGNNEEEPPTLSDEQYDDLISDEGLEVHGSRVAVIALTPPKA